MAVQTGIPSQVRAVDPFSSYESDNVNKITRFMTNGVDLIAQGLDISKYSGNDYSLNITSGVCVMDDVSIHIEEDTIFSLEDGSGQPEPEMFFDGTVWPLGTVYPAIGYLIFTYTYAKTPIVPVALARILKDITSFDEDEQLFLAKVVFSASITISYVANNDSANGVYRRENNWGTYTDAEAVAALGAPSVLDYNKYLHTNSVTGLIEYIDATTNSALSWTGTPITVTHELGHYPLIQIMETSSGDIISAALINHVDTDSFTVDFDPITTSPYNFTVIYT